MMKRTIVLATLVVCALVLSAFGHEEKKKQFGAGLLKIQGDEYCDTCKFVVQYIEGYLAQNMTEQEIMMMMEQLCSIAPKTFQPECYDFVKTWVPYIIQYLATEDPEMACEDLGLCSAKTVIDPIKDLATIYKDLTLGKGNNLKRPFTPPHHKLKPVQHNDQR